MSPIIVDKAEKRSALIRSAARVFSEQGFQSSTMAGIAQRAGVAKGSLYQYFDTKENLIYSVFEWFQADLMSRVTKALDRTGPVADKLQVFAHAAVAGVAEHREWYPLTLEIWAACTTQRSRKRWVVALQRLYDDYRSLITQLIREGQSSGEFAEDLEPNSLAAALTGAVDGVLLQCWFDPELDPQSLIDGFLRTMLRGMTP